MYVYFKFTKSFITFTLLKHMVWLNSTTQDFIFRVCVFGGTYFCFLDPINLMGHPFQVADQNHINEVFICWPQDLPIVWTRQLLNVYQNINIPSSYLQFQCFPILFPLFIYLSYLKRNITKCIFYLQTYTAIYKPRFIFKDKWCRFIELMSVCMYIGTCMNIGTCMFIYACMSSS